MKSIFILLCVLVLVPGVLAGTVTRNFSEDNIKINEEIIVSLTVDVNEEDQVYAIQEKVPERVRRLLIQAK